MRDIRVQAYDFAHRCDADFFQRMCQTDLRIQVIALTCFFRVNLTAAFLFVIIFLQMFSARFLSLRDHAARMVD